MSDLNISILSRILSSYLQEHSEEAELVREVMGAADGDGQANEEDNVLSEPEAQRYIGRQQEAARTVRQRLNILTSRRDSLVGTLTAAQETLRRANAPEELINLLPGIAGQDQDAENLSLPELQNAIQQLEQMAQEGERLSSSGFLQQVETLLANCRRLERANPEAFLPETEAAQRAPIDLNFLKYLEEGDWQQIDSLDNMIRNRSDRRPDLGNVQVRFYLAVLTLLQTAGIDWHNRQANWTLSFENVQAALREVPRENGEGPASPELELAGVRYAADRIQQDLGRLQGQRLRAHPERTALGLSFLPLINGRPQVFAQFPSLDLALDQAGEDGILTLPELARGLRHMYIPHVETMPDPAQVMEELRLLVTAQTPAAPAADPVARSGDPFVREVSRLVLDDLRRMREGFTERDTQLVTQMPMDHLVDGVSWLVTLGGNTTGGDTYEDVQRGFAELADMRRGRALESLRRLIEHPERTAGFQAWLARRSGPAAQVNIPNALAYLATQDSAAAAMLNGPFFQATRLWNIRQIQDQNAQARAWLSLASDLRGGYRGDGVASWVHSVPNLAFARAILHALRRQPSDTNIRREARIAFQDSMGYHITDDAGNELPGIRNGPNGELGLWIPDWFRNYPDEAIASAPMDAVLLGASLYTGYSAFGFGRSLLTATGRRAFLVSLGEFAGVRATGLATASGEATALSQTWLGRAIASPISRRVAEAQARLETAVTAADQAAARAALARARNVEQILTSPIQALADSGSVGNAVVGAGRVVGRLGSAAAQTRVGRAFNWLLLEGTLSYAIGGLLYYRFLRVTRPALTLDREYRLNLSRGPAEASPARRN
ncbi:MAG: hypothetical protein U1F66_12110 [bacterium]